MLIEEERICDSDEFFGLQLSDVSVSVLVNYEVSHTKIIKTIKLLHNI